MRLNALGYFVLMIGLTSVGVLFVEKEPPLPKPGSIASATAPCINHRTGIEHLTELANCTNASLRDLYRNGRISWKPDVPKEKIQDRFENRFALSK